MYYPTVSTNQKSEYNTIGFSVQGLQSLKSRHWTGTQSYLRLKSSSKFMVYCQHWIFYSYRTWSVLSCWLPIRGRYWLLKITYHSQTQGSLQNMAVCRLLPSVTSGPLLKGLTWLGQTHPFSMGGNYARYAHHEWESWGSSSILHSKLTLEQGCSSLPVQVFSYFKNDTFTQFRPLYILVSFIGEDKI